MKGAADLIAELGGDPIDIAHRSKILPDALFETDILVLGYSMTDFFELAAAECNYRSFGMRLAEIEDADPLGALGSFLDSPRTVGEMLTDLASHFEVFSEAAVVSLEQADGGVVISFEGRAGHCDSEIQMVEFALATNILSVRKQCPSDWMPIAVMFRHAAPREPTRHREIFGANIMHEQDRNGIYYDSATLGRSWHGAPFDRRADAERALRDADAIRRPLIAARAEVAMRSQMNMADSMIATVSARMGMPPRTLQRKLELENTSFRAIRDTVRSDLALKYVRQSELSLTQIAEILYYSELSAFDRAFRRW